MAQLCGIEEIVLYGITWPIHFDVSESRHLFESLNLYIHR